MVPVLDRPHRAAPLVESYLETGGEVSRLVFVCSPNDAAQEAAARATGATVLVVDFDAGPGDYARKVNYAYRDTAAWTGSEFVFTGADDLDFRPGWLEAALEAAERQDAGVVGTDDLANPTVRRGLHSTHSLVRRSYVDEHGATFDRVPGVLLFEGYDHQYVDTELVKVAMDRRAWFFCRGARVHHLHPFFSRSVPRDATYAKGLRQGQADRKLYARRLRVWERSL